MDRPTSVHRRIYPSLTLVININCLEKNLKKKTFSYNIQSVLKGKIKYSIDITFASWPAGFAATEPASRPSSAVLWLASLSNPPPAAWLSVAPCSAPPAVLAACSVAPPLPPARPPELSPSPPAASSASLPGLVCPETTDLRQFNRAHCIFLNAQHTKTT